MSKLLSFKSRVILGFLVKIRHMVFTKVYWLLAIVVGVFFILSKKGNLGMVDAVLAIAFVVIGISATVVRNIKMSDTDYYRLLTGFLKIFEETKDDEDLGKFKSYKNSIILKDSIVSLNSDTFGVIKIKEIEGVKVHKQKKRSFVYVKTTNECIKIHAKNKDVADIIEQIQKQNAEVKPIYVEVGDDLCDEVIEKIEKQIKPAY